MHWLLRLDKTARLVLLSVVLGLVGGFGAQLFLWLLHLGEVLIYAPITGSHFLTVKAAVSLKRMPAFHLNWWIPLATTSGGFLAGVLVYTFAPEAEGHGTDAVVRAFHQTKGLIRARVPVVKTLASAITIGSGGVFAPSLYIGALLGAALAVLLHFLGAGSVSSTGMAVVGMAAVFAGAARVPIATLVMVTEMTGGYHLIMPTMLAVALSYLVQFSLTRHARYPTLYEAQVVAPTDSPVHRELYYKAAADLLRRREVKLDEDILASQLADQASAESGIPLGGTRERLFRTRLAAGSPLADAEIRSLGIQDFPIITILRSDHQIVPGGGTVLQVGDELVVAAVPDAMRAFREHASPLAAPKPATA